MLQDLNRINVDINLVIAAGILSMLMTSRHSAVFAINHHEQRADVSVTAGALESLRA